mmetsp:Transcript_12836/g.26215  ORF Transcript_12836/g.26215 Transcript_12836/m.26215 type:complete len:221 (-) Transcript_12836:197-859(-)
MTETNPVSDDTYPPGPPPCPPFDPKTQSARPQPSRPTTFPPLSTSLGLSHPSSPTIPPSQARLRRLLSRKLSSCGLNEQACYEFFLASPAFSRDFVKLQSTGAVYVWDEPSRLWVEAAVEVVAVSYYDHVREVLKGLVGDASSPLRSAPELRRQEGNVTTRRAALAPLPHLHPTLPKPLKLPPRPLRHALDCIATRPLPIPLPPRLAISILISNIPPTGS